MPASNNQIWSSIFQHIFQQALACAKTPPLISAHRAEIKGVS